MGLELKWCHVDKLCESIWDLFKMALLATSGTRTYLLTGGTPDIWMRGIGNELFADAVHSPAELCEMRFLRGRRVWDYLLAEGYDKCPTHVPSQIRTTLVGRQSLDGAASGWELRAVRVEPVGEKMTPFRGGWPFPRPADVAYPLRSNEEAAPTPESYWVVPGQVVAGKYPGAKSDAEAQTKIDALVAAGVRTFVDLTEDAGLLPYAQFLPDGAAHRRVPVVDVTCPTREQVREALDTIDAGLERGVVYVHCRGGCGRTGVVLGAYLVRHGESPQAALSRVHDLTRALWDKPCPETREQIAMVETWAEGE